MAVVITKPAIIMIQTSDAAAARRAGAVREASSTNKDVPAAPTPAPISKNATTASAMPAHSDSAINAVPAAAKTPPKASTAMPPMIQGVRRPPISDP